MTNVLVEPANNNRVDLGYQILTTEEAERDQQKIGNDSSVKERRGYFQQPSPAPVTTQVVGSRSKPKRRQNMLHMPSSKGAKGKYKMSYYTNDMATGGDNLSRDLENANRLLDVKAAIEQLKLRGASESSNEDDDRGGSSCSDDYTSASDEDSEPTASVTVKKSIDMKKKSTNKVSMPFKQASSQHVAKDANDNNPLSKERHRNEDTVGLSSAPCGDPTPPMNNTPSASVSAGAHSGGGGGITNSTAAADEFVWIDSYNRLVELQKFPWNHGDLCSGLDINSIFFSLVAFCKKIIAWRANQ